jgi:hypothetical protein
MPRMTGPVSTSSHPHSAGPPAGRLRHAWVLIPAVLFFVYSGSFSSYPVVEQKVSAVGEADGASYSIIFRSFTLSHQFGDPYNLHDRTVGDVAQKHKLHHFIAAALGRVVYEGFRPLYRLAGLPPERAVYSVSALWTCLNLVLLALLLRGSNPHGNSVLPFLAFYGLSLTVWLFGSVPESWALSGSMFLAFVLLLRSGRAAPIPLAVLLGIFMLNNMALGALLALLWLRLWKGEPLGPRLLAKAGGVAALTIAVWLACLSLISIFDPMFRPDRFWMFSRWFRQYLHVDLPLTSAYVWKSALTNLFVNSLVTNQGDPNIPMEAMLTTLRTSRLGLAAIVAILLLLGLGVVRVIRAGRELWQRDRSMRTVLTEDALQPVIWCGVMVAVTLVLSYASGFIYAALVVPMLAMLLCRHLDLRIAAHRVIVLTAVAMLVVNNVDQVLRFRDILAATR